MGDLKFALRQLLKSPAFTAVAILTLALGIGATTAIFSVVYALLVSPYPYAKPSEIWSPGLHSASVDQRSRTYRMREYVAMSELPAFAATMATAPDQMLLTGTFAPETLQTIRISGSAGAFLGVAPILGRTIGPADVGTNGEPLHVAVLSFRLWQRLFAGGSDALGQKLLLNDEPYTVIGVMPPRFGWWTSDGLWVPLGLESPSREVFPIVRLAPGATKTIAEQQLQTLQLQFAADNRNEYPQEPFTSQLTNYLDITVASGEMKQSLELLFGAVGFLLLIACANVASLQLARGSSRLREIAVRLSLGAPRGRIVRQLLTESVLMSGIGGVLGLAFAFAITRLMVALMPDFLVPNEARVEVNGIVLSFCAGVSVLTGVVFGLVPALQSSRPNVTDALKDEAWGSSSMVGGKTRAALVVTEVALCVMLLVSAGLTIRAFIAVEQVELGFEPEQVMTASFTLPLKRYESPEKRNRFAADLLERVQSLPGVRSASVGNGGLPFFGMFSRYSIGGDPSATDGRFLVQLASADYLRTLGVALREGRTFSEREIANAEHVAVINETAARLWAGESPVGRVIRLDELGRLSPDSGSEVTVIGVSADTRNAGLRRDALPAALLPFTLIPLPGRALAIRTQLDPGTLMNVLRAQVREIDPEVPVRGPSSLFDALDAESIQPRFTMSLFTLFAALGLALAMAGIYSVLSHLVELRTREVGVRMALGAERRHVLLMFLKTGVRLVGSGLGLGLVGSLGVVRVLSSRLDLSRVDAVDPLTIALTILLLAAVTAAACYLPARRATRVDPMVALRRN